MDKAEFQIGFGDFEHLAASLFAFSATFEICRDDRIVGRANAQITDESGIQPAQLDLQASHGLLSCAEWTGVRLALLLEETGVERLDSNGRAW
jgi:hypothetical protein